MVMLFNGPPRKPHSTCLQGGWCYSGQMIIACMVVNNNIL